MLQCITPRFPQRSVPILNMTVSFIGLIFLPGHTFGAQLRRRLHKTPTAGDSMASAHSDSASNNNSQPDTMHENDIATIAAAYDDRSTHNKESNLKQTRDNTQETQEVIKKSQRSNIEKAIAFELSQLKDARTAFDEWKTENLDDADLTQHHPKLHQQLELIYELFEKVYTDRTAYWQRQNTLCSENQMAFDEVQCQQFRQNAKHFQKREDQYLKFCKKTCDEYFRNAARQRQDHERESNHLLEKIRRQEAGLGKKQERLLQRERDILKDQLAQQQAEIERARREIEAEKEALRQATPDMQE